MLKSIFLGTLTIITLCNCAFGQSKADKIDELLSKYAEYGRFNGTVLVADKGEIVYKKGFGLANAEWGIPNQTDTKFRLASVSKQFTATLIVQLASENKLKLDAPISTYLPDYPKKTGDIVTVHHLLTHSSGIPNYTSFPIFREMMRDPYSPEEMVRLFADSTLEFTPGEKFQYSNSGYILLGYIIEKITGEPYEQALQTRIFTPLKMNNSGYDHNRSVIKNRASGYEKLGNTLQNTNYIDMSVPYAAGGIYSTVEDLYLWDQALYSEKLLPKKYRDLLFEKYISADQDYYGYGWFVGEMPIGNTREQVKTNYHGGGINGFNTLITRIPSDKSFIVLLNNTSEAPLGEITIAISGILYDKPYRFPKKSIAYTLLDVIAQNGLESALLYYTAIKDSSAFYLNENEINVVGYQLLQSNKAREAAAIFKINVEKYPNSFNVYDSYGEALMVLGEKNLAIENYKKSVQLNPGSESGLKVLREAGIDTDALITKVPIEQLKQLEGEYLSANGEWKIEFTVVNGELTGNDKGYKYRLVPVGDNTFINPDDGASLVFDTKDKNAITLMLFGTKLRKVKWRLLQELCKIRISKRIALGKR